MRPLPGGGLYRRSGRTCAVIYSLVSLDLASVATLVMCERDVSAAYPSGMGSTGSSPVAALFAYRGKEDVERGREDV